MSKKSKFTGKAKAAPVEQTTEQTTPVAPVTTAAPVTSGRTIVAIAKELKITPVNARRLARQHAAELGHTAKGQRWELSPDQAARFIELATAPKAAKVAAQ